MAARKVLLIGWDAADWKVIHPLIGAGKMPNLQRLVEHGATGQITTLYPPLSPMLWTSIATGQRPFKHGILGFSEPTPDGRGVRPITNLSRKVKALWNIFSQNDLRSIVIGWWPSHPAEPINGVMVSDHYHRANAPLGEGWPLLANAVHPPDLTATLAGLRVHPDSLVPSMVEPFIPLAEHIDQDHDKRLALFLRTLAECMSMQSAAMWLVENQPWDFFTVYYDAIDHFCHGFMKYHPPRQSWVTEGDFDVYHNVISTAYQFHDRMLGALLEKAGDDVTVILMSDHGFHPDHLRPASIPDVPAGPTVEHRELGILAIQGPGIRKDVSLHGPSVLDIAPTILTLYGLPVGEDMDGKVLSQAFIKPPKVAFIPTWEAVPGAAGRHPPHTRLDPVAAQAALEQMVALGYIERPDENREIAVDRTIRELRFNLAESYQDDDRHQEAYEIFAELHAADPNEQRFAVQLFVSCQALGKHQEMRRIVDLARWQPAVIDYLKAQVLISEDRPAEALEALERVTEAHLVRPALFLQTADLYRRLRRWRDAQSVYEKALAIDPDNPHAHLGLCRMALRRRKFDVAAQSALDAIERDYHHPQAHFLLGLALTGMQQYQRAAEAFRTAISFNPNFPEAHVRLATLLEKHLSDPQSAREHRRLARRMRSQRIGAPAPEETAPTLALAETQFPAKQAEIPPLEKSLIVVSGLPRSGTSMLMQMLAAGGVSVLSDGSREPDEDNPRGYLEVERVKDLLKDSNWLLEERGKAVKIVAPLLAALPQGLPCRVILTERDIDEVLDSQERMLIRRHQASSTPERRRLLRAEYARALDRAKELLQRRPSTELLVIEHRDVISNPLAIAEKMNQFLSGGLNITKMAAAIDPALHRNRTAEAGIER
jgi:tetratricopeptide (TPR) repeat protein